LTIKSTSHTFRPRGSRERLIDATFYSRLLVSTSGSRPYPCGVSGRHVYNARQIFNFQRSRLLKKPEVQAQKSEREPHILTS